METTDIDQLRACARAEEAFAALESAEPNPWEGSKSRLLELETVYEHEALRARGQRLQIALADLRRVTIAIARLREDHLANGAQEREKAASPTIVRWKKAYGHASAIGASYAWTEYALWVTSGKPKARSAWQHYAPPDWPPQIVFDDDAARAEVIAWREIGFQGTVIQHQIDSAEGQRAELIAQFPELMAVCVEIPPREPAPAAKELVGAARGTLNRHE